MNLEAAPKEPVAKFFLLVLVLSAPSRPRS